ncbi:MAG: ribosome maturation factor RimM [Actinomycetota bacterium]|jgi:16S rRNA processing protein RimM|nr:ribosome maturation factor RimM [Actinomycetota bacterium]
MTPEGLLEVGFIGKAHGLNGDVSVKLVTNRLERVAPGSVLDTEHGPLVVEQSRPHQERYLVKFEGIGNRNAAETLRGRVLFATPIEDEGELWVHQLVGSTVVDQDGVERGVVDSVQANPASDLLVLDTGHLVPLAFVSDSSDLVVRVDVPAGLFDLGN